MCRVLSASLLYMFAVGEEPLQVARCTKIINAGQDNARYMINVKQFARFVVELGDQVAPSDIEEGMRVGSVCPVFLLRKLLYPTDLLSQQFCSYLFLFNFC